MRPAEQISPWTCKCGSNSLSAASQRRSRVNIANCSLNTDEIQESTLDQLTKVITASMLLKLAYAAAPVPKIAVTANYKEKHCQHECCRPQVIHHVGEEMQHQPDRSIEGKDHENKNTDEEANRLDVGEAYPLHKQPLGGLASCECFQPRKALPIKLVEEVMQHKPQQQNVEQSKTQDEHELNNLADHCMFDKA